MSDVLFTSLLIITILIVIAAVVLSIMSYNAAKATCEESATYSTYSAITSGLTVILIGISILLFLFACPTSCPLPPKDNTKELVEKAAQALQVHADKLKVHAGILNEAFGKVNTISSDLSKICKDAKGLCPTQDR